MDWTYSRKPDGQGTLNRGNKQVASGVTEAWAEYYIGKHWEEGDRVFLRETDGYLVRSMAFGRRRGWREKK